MEYRAGHSQRHDQNLHLQMQQLFLGSPPNYNIDNPTDYCRYKAAQPVCEYVKNSKQKHDNR